MSATETTTTTTTGKPSFSLDRALRRRLWEFLRPHRRTLGLGMLVLAGTFVTDLLAPWITREAIDGPVREALGVEAEVDRGGATRAVLGWAAAFLVVAAGGALLRYAQTVLLVRVGQGVTYDVRGRLYSHLLHLPAGWHDHHPSGELVTRVTSDVENLAELFSSGVATFLFDLVRVVGVLIALFWIDARLASVLVAGLPVFVAVSVLFRTRARRAYAEARRVLAEANSFAQESVHGASVVQLHGQEQRMIQRFAGHGRRLREAWMRTVSQYAVFLPLVDFVNHLIVALSFGWGAVLILDGEMTAGQFLQYWFYLRLIGEPIQQIAERYNVLQSAMASTERIHGILEQAPEADGRHEGPIAGKVTLEGVSLAYDGENDVLRDLDLRLEQGETVAVVGATGAGKSSLARLLLRLYQPRRGRVLVDGRPAEDWTLASLRRGIGVVPQEVFLFADSILENVRLRDTRITEEQVRLACERVGAASFIEALPEAYRTRLGERGVNLSVGQRQLLALARVLVLDPALLVLDEATSSVDSETEYQVQRAVDEVLEGRSSLVIAHRLSTIRRADRIVVLHKGRIREQGRHRELLEAGGIYARLHRLQFGDERA